jgi:hypothetical protein
MKFIVQPGGENIVSISRKIGYKPLGVNVQEEYSIVRPINVGNYPRFHIYVKEGKEGELIFNLHLDQKKPSYGISHAHNAEYDGELVEGEAERIKGIIK